MLMALFCASAAAQENNSAIFKLAQQKSLEESGRVYPDLRNEKSEMWQICNQIAMEARDPKSPNHAILAKADAPMIIAKMAAQVMAERAALPKYVVAVRSVPFVKSSVNGGWKVDKGEVAFLCGG